jgi:hypothetical protein
LGFAGWSRNGGRNLVEPRGTHASRLPARFAIPYPRDLLGVLIGHEVFGRGVGAFHPELLRNVRIVDQLLSQNSEDRVDFALL